MMPQLLLFDDHFRNNFLPFTHTRPCADLLCGSFTFRERWELLLHSHSSTITEVYLSQVYPASFGNDNLYVNGLAAGTDELAKAIATLEPEQSLFYNDRLLAFRSTATLKSYSEIEQAAIKAKKIAYTNKVLLFYQVWELFLKNQEQQIADYQKIIAGKKPIAQHTAIVSTAHQIFIEEGAKVGLGVIMNANDGPIFIEHGAEVQDGAIIKGPFTLRKKSSIKMAAKIYGACTIGEGCKVGGEVSNTLFFANSNKGHDGFLGNSIIGEWCNLGADTNSSNLKNNYDEIKIWDEHLNKSVKTGLQFCGLLMGDHSKSGINTMFNTGTVVGVSANIFGAGFPEKFIPSFSWGGAEGQTTYQFHKAVETAQRVVARRGLTLSDAQVQVLKHVFELTQKQRDTFLRA